MAAKFENSLCELLRQRAECRTPDDEEDTFELAVMEKCLQSVVNRASGCVYSHKAVISAVVWLFQFTIRVSHCTPMVDRLLRDMSYSEVSSDNLFRMFPLQNALTHYELSLQNILELLRVTPLQLHCCYCKHVPDVIAVVCLQTLLNDDDELRNLCISPAIPAVCVFLFLSANHTSIC